MRLLDNRRLVSQSVNLEGRTARGGRDSINHPQGQHDDCINAAAGALVLAAGLDPDGFDAEIYLKAFLPGYVESKGEEVVCTIGTFR